MIEVVTQVVLPMTKVIVPLTQSLGPTEKIAYGAIAGALGSIISFIVINTTKTVVRGRKVPNVRGTWKVSYFDGQSYVHEEDAKVKQFGTRISGQIKSVKDNIYYKFSGEITPSRYLNLSFRCKEEGTDSFGTALYKLDSLTKYALGESVTAGRDEKIKSYKVRVEFDKEW